MRGTRNHFLASTCSIDMLVKYGVIKEKRLKSRDCLKSDNVNLEKLYELGREMATAVGIPKEAKFRGQNGVQAFDYSSKGWCAERLRFLNSEESTTAALVMPVGDALVNPFWPHGFGINRGFHGAMDASFIANLYSKSQDDHAFIKEAREEAQAMDG